MRENMTSNFGYMTSFRPRKALIRHITQMDLKAMGELARQLKHEELVDRITNRINKTWVEKK